MKAEAKAIQIRKKRKHSTFDMVNTTLVALITLVVFYPLYFCVIASFSDPREVALGRTLLWFGKFTTEVYQEIFKEKQIWVGYRNTILYTVAGTLYNLVLMIPAAYVLSKKRLPFRNFISWYFFLTMYFGGGMIPTYLLYRSLRLVGSPLAMVLGSGVSAYNLIITRQYFANSIPEAFYDAASIDGASELRCFFSIALPLSKPVLAVMTLYHAVGHWNSFFNALIYLKEPKYFPLQLVLRNILFKSQNIGSISTDEVGMLEYLVRKALMAESMKYGLVIVSSLPMLIAYPFVQKHFTKGIMIGGVKG